MPTCETQEAIEKTATQVARLESRLAREKLKARRADTRCKIEFGGLVIKAGLSKYPKAVILGAIIDAVEQLVREDEGILDLFKLKGEAAFMQD